MIDDRRIQLRVPVVCRCNARQRHRARATFSSVYTKFYFVSAFFTLPSLESFLHAIRMLLWLGK